MSSKRTAHTPTKAVLSSSQTQKQPPAPTEQLSCYLAKQENLGFKKKLHTLEKSKRKLFTKQKEQRQPTETQMSIRNPLYSVESSFSATTSSSSVSLSMSISTASLNNMKISDHRLANGQPSLFRSNIVNFKRRSDSTNRLSANSTRRTRQNIEENKNEFYQNPFNNGYLYRQRFNLTSPTLSIATAHRDDDSMLPKKAFKALETSNRVFRYNINSDDFSSFSSLISSTGTTLTNNNFNNTRNKNNRSSTSYDTGSSRPNSCCVSSYIFKSKLNHQAGKNSNGLGINYNSQTCNKYPFEVLNVNHKNPLYSMFCQGNGRFTGDARNEVNYAQICTIHTNFATTI